jgi:hypothetical protein
MASPLPILNKGRHARHNYSMLGWIPGRILVRYKIIELADKPKKGA